jgi:hypothetical protein
MRKLIIQSNEWYDNLIPTKRLLFFVVVIMGTLMIAEYLMYIYDFIWAIPIWFLMFFIWRCGYNFIMWRTWYNNNKKI